MLLTKSVTIKWNPKNKEWYESKGYQFTKCGEEFEVEIGDVTHGSKIQILVKCDYCNKEFPKEYGNYLRERKCLDKDTCRCCNKIKHVEITNIKNNAGELNKEDQGYWGFRENRMQLVQNFIIEHNTLNNIQDFEGGKRIYGILSRHGEKAWQIAIELGYNIDELMCKKAKTYYDIYDNLEKDIRSLVESKFNNNFPAQYYICKNLNISSRVLEKHGGLQVIKEKMGYLDEDDFIDLRGDSNKSEIELMVANYLCLHGLKDKYTREQHPFPSYEGRYRSDFTFILENKDIIQCEVWGMLKNIGDSRNEIHNQYNKTRKIKESLYIKHNIYLISLDYELFLQSYEVIVSVLNEKFKTLLGENVKRINYVNLIPKNKLTEEEIMDRIMEYSDDKDYIPTQEQIISGENGTTLYLYMMRKFGGLNYFANKFNKKISMKKFYWNDNVVNENFLFMLKKYNKILSQKEIDDNKDENFKGMYSYIGRQNRIAGKSMYDFKLNFYNYCIKGNLGIGETEYQYLVKISEGKTKSRRNLTQTHIDFAKEIIDKIIR